MLLKYPPLICTQTKSITSLISNEILQHETSYREICYIVVDHKLLWDIMNLTFWKCHHISNLYHVQWSVPDKYTHHLCKGVTFTHLTLSLHMWINHIYHPAFWNFFCRIQLKIQSVKLQNALFFEKFIYTYQIMYVLF